MKKDLKGLTFEELKELISSIGEKPFRAKQIYPFIFKGIESIDEIGNIPKTLKEKLKEISYISSSKIFQKFESKIDSTKKYLIELDDKNIVETVLMEYRHGLSICISSQVGCRMGCKFCASTIDGLVRNLLPGEMLGQILSVQKDIGKRISNIVIMGSGEPFDNYDNFVQFLKVVHEEEGLNVGYRHITVSTCGIVPKIYEFADLNLPVNLAISLHETNQAKREELMPVGKAYSIKEVIDSAKYYTQKTKRRITFEYSLIKGVNDSKKDAEDLSSLLKGMLCHVNLIPVNNIKERDFKKPDIKSSQEFNNILKNKNIESTIRREMGKDINGACGQLRQSAVK